MRSPLLLHICLLGDVSDDKGRRNGIRGLAKEERGDPLKESVSQRGDV